MERPLQRRLRSPESRAALVGRAVADAPDTAKAFRKPFRQTQPLGMGEQRHQRDPGHQSEIVFPDLQKLIVRYSSDAPKDIGRGLPDQTKNRNLEAVRVYDHAGLVQLAYLLLAIRQ
jgi:hypothetical protein